MRWKARGQHLSQEARTELLAEAEKKRYARRQAEQEMYEATNLSKALKTGWRSKKKSRP